MDANNPYPVVVIGAGPVGLAAAAHLVERGIEPLVLEAGARGRRGVREWGHVRLFSPWELSTRPPRGCSSDRLDGADRRRLPDRPRLVEVPRAARRAAGRGRVRFGARVTGVTRAGVDKLVDARPREAPFLVRRRSTAAERRYLAARRHRRLGHLVHAQSARRRRPSRPRRARARRAISYRVPDSRPRPRALRRKRVRRRQRPLRRHRAPPPRRARASRRRARDRLGDPRRGLGGVSAAAPHDQLPAAARSARRVEPAVEDGYDRARRPDSGRAPRGTRDARLVLSDDAASWSRSTRSSSRPASAPISRCSVSCASGSTTARGAAALAPLIDPNVHSCGTVPPHGAGSSRIRSRTSTWSA